MANTAKSKDSETETAAAEIALPSIEDVHKKCGVLAGEIEILEKEHNALGARIYRLGSDLNAWERLKVAIETSDEGKAAETEVCRERVTTRRLNIRPRLGAALDLLQQARPDTVDEVTDTVVALIHCELRDRAARRRVDLTVRPPKRREK